jgi:hypothetical protein
MLHFVLCRGKHVGYGCRPFCASGCADFKSFLVVLRAYLQGLDNNPGCCGVLSSKTTRTKRRNADAPRLWEANPTEHRTSNIGPVYSRVSSTMSFIRRTGPPLSYERKIIHLDLRTLRRLSRLTPSESSKKRHPARWLAPVLLRCTLACVSLYLSF